MWFFSGLLHMGASRFLLIFRQVFQLINILKYIDNKTVYPKIARLFLTGYFKTNIKLCDSPTGEKKPSQPKIRICSYQSSVSIFLPD